MKHRIERALMRGLAFLSEFAFDSACWEEHDADVLYMFFHFATRSSLRGFAVHSRRQAVRAANRWRREDRFDPSAGASALLWHDIYGYDTLTRLGYDTSRVGLALARAARNHAVSTYF